MTGDDHPEGFVTIWPSGETKPETSATQIRWSDIAVGLHITCGQDRKVSFYAHTPTHLVVDVTAVYRKHRPPPAKISAHATALKPSASPSAPVSLADSPSPSLTQDAGLCTIFQRRSVTTDTFQSDALESINGWRQMIGLAEANLTERYSVVLFLSFLPHSQYRISISLTLFLSASPISLSLALCGTLNTNASVDSAELQLAAIALSELTRLTHTVPAGACNVSQAARDLLLTVRDEVFISF
jgi:hypothetical protein